MADGLQTGLVTLADYRREQFEPLLGETLVFADAAGQPLSLKLLEVTARPQTGTAREPFSLLFTLVDRPLPHGLIIFCREGFAAEGWFINRVSILGGDPQIAYCEAIFS